MREFQVGDVCKIVGNSRAHNFKDGEFVRVTSVCSDDYYVEGWVTMSDGTVKFHSQLVYADDIIPVNRHLLDDIELGVMYRAPAEKFSWSAESGTYVNVVVLIKDYTDDTVRVSTLTTIRERETNNSHIHTLWLPAHLLQKIK